MVKNQLVYDTYWKTAYERMEIFWGKKTRDPIFKTYKFCNVYRACDRVSQHLIRNVIYKIGSLQWSVGNEVDMLFRIFLFRLINRPQTWEALERVLGEIRLSNFEFEKYAKVFEQLPRPIYGNAFILCANKVFGYDKKYLNQLAVLKVVNWQRLEQCKSLKELYCTLLELPLIGDFMAYQIAIDMNYSPVFEFDENEFTKAGPGAIRGIEKCFLDLGSGSYEYIINHMVEVQEIEFSRLGLPFRNLFGRPLKAIDCQNWFCETDKYCREKFPEMISNRKKIKAIYKPQGNRIDYFFPPKWKLG